MIQKVLDFLLTFFFFLGIVLGLVLWDIRLINPYSDTW